MSVGWIPVLDREILSVLLGRLVKYPSCWLHDLSIHIPSCFPIGTAETPGRRHRWEEGRPRRINAVRLNLAKAQNVEVFMNPRSYKSVPENASGVPENPEDFHTLGLDTTGAL